MPSRTCESSSRGSPHKSRTQPGFWRQVVERLGTAVLVLDTAGRVIAANPAAERLLGRTAAAMRGADAHDLLHRDADGNKVPRDRCPLLHALAEGQGARGEGGTYLRGDGRLLAVSWCASPLTEDGSVQGMALLFTDATGDRRVHRERTARTRALEDLNERLSLVAEITDVLGQTLETDEALARLVRLLVPRLADWAAVDLRTGSGEVHRVTVTGPEGRDAGFQGRSVLGAEGAGEGEDSPLGRALTGGESVRSLAWDHTGPPGAVVDRLDAAMPVITTVPLATLILARVEGDPDTGPWTLRWTSAGHPPPLLLSPDGTACFLEAGQGLLLGTGSVGDADRPDATHPLKPGSTLLLYTDGLVETPGSDLDTGLDRLLRHALTLVHEPLDRLCGKVLAHLPPGSTDDVALLALRVPPP